jgi:hypothetical protein
MLFIIIEFVAGGALLCLLMGVKSWESGELIRLFAPDCTTLKRWQKALTRLAISTVAATCLLDPLVPGTARLTVKVSAPHQRYMTLPENLYVHVVPLGLFGQAGGDRISNVELGMDGSAEVLATLTYFDTSVLVQVSTEHCQSGP